MRRLRLRRFRRVLQQGLFGEIRGNWKRFGLADGRYSETQRRVQQKVHGYESHCGGPDHSSHLITRL